MAKTNQPIEVRSAQGVGAFVLGALQPAVIINPAASKADLLFWARAELGSLHQWLEFVATATNCQEVTPSEFALMVTDKLEPVLRGFDAALEDGRA
jgi:hypothetical protein